MLIDSRWHINACAIGNEIPPKKMKKKADLLASDLAHEGAISGTHAAI